MAEFEKLTELTSDQVADYCEVGELWVRVKDHTELISALTAQCQRDFALAAEWKATAEEYRHSLQVENALCEAQRLRAEVAETRVERLESRDRSRDNFVAELQSECATLRSKIDQIKAEWTRDNVRLSAELDAVNKAYEIRTESCQRANVEIERLRSVMMIQEEPDSCARCEHVMDGYEASTGDICHDCWNVLEESKFTLSAATELLHECDEYDFPDTLKQKLANFLALKVT